jgi:GTP-binding protein
MSSIPQATPISAVRWSACCQWLTPCLLVVDAAEGPMPQTRFVTQKAFAQGLKPIVIVNKVDKVGADPHGAIDKVFDLFDQLGATDDQLDFPVVYCSAINGLSGPEPDALD